MSRATEKYAMLGNAKNMQAKIVSEQATRSRFKMTSDIQVDATKLMGMSIATIVVVIDMPANNDASAGDKALIYLGEWGIVMTTISSSLPSTFIWVTYLK